MFSPFLPISKSRRIFSSPRNYSRVGRLKIKQRYTTFTRNNDAIEIPSDLGTVFPSFLLNTQVRKSIRSTLRKRNKTSTAKDILLVECVDRKRQKAAGNEPRSRDKFHSTLSLKEKKKKMLEAFFIGKLLFTLS